MMMILLQRFIGEAKEGGGHPLCSGRDREREWSGDYAK
jgi:hypothetical protein